DFGENYVQELVAKADASADLGGIRWHAIGHVQRNKAKDVARCAKVVHTVDDARTAEAIAKRVVAGAAVEVLPQVNVAAEPQKSGCDVGALPALVRDVRALAPAIALRGLMTIPPADGDPRPFFAKLRALATEHGLPELSMGMSADLEAA